MVVITVICTEGRNNCVWELHNYKMFSWDNTKVALRDLKEELKCKLCRKIPAEPMNYNVCGHFCCKTCIKSKKNNCPICGMTCLSSEITSERLINNLITGMKIISDIINAESSGNNSGTESSDAFNGDKSSKSSGKRSSKQYPASSPSGERKVKKPRRSNSKKRASITPTKAKKSVSQNSEVKNLNKRNAKGETQLHIACLKGKTELVKEYLEAGANPNTKDHAGWTPLIEAVNHGFVDIVDLLLKFGAMVNVPGYENITPLHEAAASGKLELVKLLLKYGADTEARNISGITPRDLALTDEIKQILNSAFASPTETALIEAKGKNMDPHEMTVFGCDLNDEQQKQLVILSQQFKFKLILTYLTELTHIIVPTDSNYTCSSNRDVIHGILHGKWIINYDWVTMCLESRELVIPDTFEVKGTSHFPDSKAPKLGRINAEKQLPSIFNGCHIFLAGSSINYTTENCKLTKIDVMSLIRSGDGVLLSREPDPEGIPQSECTVPYHASNGSSLAKCSHYIIYRTGRDEPKLKYNMAHIKSLPFQWLFDCMETFTLREPYIQ